MSPRNIVLYADDDVDDIQLVREAFYSYSQNVELVTVEDGLESVVVFKKYDGRRPQALPNNSRYKHAADEWKRGPH